MTYGKKRGQVSEALSGLIDPHGSAACWDLARAVGVECRADDCWSGCEDCAARVAEAVCPHPWPRFEDGSPVRVGDVVRLDDGCAEEVCQVHIGESHYSLYTETHDEEHRHGDPARRPVGDTQEKIDADAGKTMREYWGCAGVLCDECPAVSAMRKPRERYGAKDCVSAMVADLLRRQREVDAAKAGA